MTTIQITTAEYDRLKKLAYTDQLTGAWNRAKLEELDLDEHASVILIDMNKFKRVNDELGHAMGDEVLIDFVEAVNYTLGRIFRLGGDEFVIVCENDEYVTEALDFLETWEHHTGVTTSQGVAEATDGLSAALKAADARMYANKTASRSDRRTRR